MYFGIHYGELVFFFFIFPNRISPRVIDILYNIIANNELGFITFKRLYIEIFGKLTLQALNSK